MSPLKSFNKAKLVRSWSRIAETTLDIEKILKVNRAGIKSADVVNIRRTMFAMSNAISTVMKNPTEPELAEERIAEAQGQLKTLTRQLEKLVGVKNIDRDRLKTIIDRLGIIKQLLNESVA